MKRLNILMASAAMAAVRFGDGSGGDGVPGQWRQWTTGPAGDAATPGLIARDSVRIATAVPEPRSVVLLATGLGVLGVMRRGERD